ncbi:hypothetical protein Trydic_g20985 [Trypoxylus dichotomus]
MRAIQPESESNAIPFVFLYRAAQKLNLSSSPHRRKRHNSEDAEPSGFCGVLQRSPPPVPPALLRRIGVKEITGVGKEIIKIIQQLNENNAIGIRIGSETSTELPTPRGTREGDSLSPLLFNLLMDKIIKVITDLGREYKLRSRSISMICYADDATVVAKAEDDL